MSLNNILVERASYQKHSGKILGEKPNFKRHVDNAISKIHKGISVIKNFFTVYHGYINIQSFFAALNWLWRYDE